jgi:hypothetical protein
VLFGTEKVLFGTALKLFLELQGIFRDICMCRFQLSLNVFLQFSQVNIFKILLI